MDVLSDVISTMRTGRPRSARIEWYAPWGMRFPEVPGGKFLVVLQGACWALVEGREPLQLGAGDVLFLPRGAEHALVSDPQAPVEGLDRVKSLREQGGVAEAVAGEVRGEPTCVTVGGSYFAGVTRPHPLLAQLPSVVHLPSRVGERSELPLAVGLLGRELGSGRPGGDTVIPHLLDMLVVYILRTHLEQERASGAGAGCGFAGAMRDPGVHEAIQAVHRDPSRPWTVAELGGRAGLSRAAFSRRFTALVGQSPLAYVTWWRLTTAARLLNEEDAPVGSIATRVGYSSQFAFANAFKREFGVSPGRYREGTRSERFDGSG
ncbi:AraC family transcriptional regulator [Nocardiopsis sp. JB363]|uniref:AraC family transcriptional regulator n=1 Tax=Nocardiopsis sp. JB363 TaxID=1434837 RepID=UPI00097AFD52|nr:AraC family transcriptional regulator [Nocardiopsis sp. JB363]SIO85931.1 Transcriptional regulator, AraC family [Nocardiopsis sp. JB363]